MTSDVCPWNNTLCHQLGVVYMLVDHISQRDISYSTGCDQAYQPGISVNAMGSDWQMWMQTSAAIGFKAFYMDFTWDSTTKDWSLCPSANATACASLYNVSTVLGDYINQTDTDLEVDLLRISMRFKTTTDLSRSDLAAINRTDLSKAILPVVSRVLTPWDVVNSQDMNNVAAAGSNRWKTATLWPSLQTTLLTKKARLVVSVDTEQLPVNVTFNPLEGTAFNTLRTYSDLAPIKWPRQELYNTTVDFDALANDPFRSLSIENSSSDKVVSMWMDAMENGFSPVLNGSITNATLYNLGAYYQWPWHTGSPAFETADDRRWLLSNQNYSMCAAQTPLGWEVGNCHTEGQVLCLNNSNAFDWTFAEAYTPFSAAEDGNVCPHGYYFASPVTHLQSVAVKQALVRNNVSWAWTNINSLSVENCWVSGVNTLCPYNIVQGNRNGVAVLTVISAIGFGLIILMIFLEYRHLHMPLTPRKKRKGLKKEPKK